MERTIEHKVLSQIIKISNHLREQDNRCTNQPIFHVRGLRRLYGMDNNYCERMDWLDDEGNLVGEGEGVQVGYMDKWEVISCFFTEKGAERYLQENSHRFSDYLKTDIYVDTLYRNTEMIAVRDFLLSIGPYLKKSNNSPTSTVLELITTLEQESINPTCTFLSSGDLRDIISLLRELIVYTGQDKQRMEVTKYDAGGGIKIERRGVAPTETWAICDGSMCMDKDGNWEYEPMPSSRTKDFLQKYRFPSPKDALDTLMKFQG